MPCCLLVIDIHATSTRAVTADAATIKAVVTLAVLPPAIANHLFLLSLKEMGLDRHID